MYTIKWVADQLGVAPGTLRAWEHRYAVVQPARTEAGHRVYSDQDLAALRAMARLVDAGIQPAQAADQVRNGALTRPAENQASESTPGLPDPRALIVAASSYDLRALETALDAAFSAASFEHVAGTWLMTALSEVGEAWHRGELDVAQEHFVSTSVMRRLSAAFDAAGQAWFGRRVLIGLAPGATHEIATLAFATMLRRAGLGVTYLGPDLPVDSWVEAVRATRPDAAVVTAPRQADGPAAAEVMAALRRQSPQIRSHVAGPGRAAIEGAMPGDTLIEALDWLVSTLNSR